MKIPVLRRLADRVRKAVGTLSGVDNRGGWTPWIREPFTGAWQTNQELRVDTVLAYQTVYACVTLIANDIAKLRLRLVQKSPSGIWTEAESPAFGPVLRKPNRYQNHIQFKQWWVMSKLVHGNSYALKQRDNRGLVTALYIIDPSRVTVLVAADGGVYYQLGTDNLSGVNETSITVPASEIIHDRMNCLFHPLVGVSPLYAAALAATQGLRIQNDATNFFKNGARPGGVLTAPGSIASETAARLKETWETNFGGDNAGRTAVLGDGLKFEPIRMNSTDAQLVEQLGWTAQAVCSAFHVPGFKVGVGQMPAGQKVGDLNQIYYTDCLQSLIEEMELCLDEGLGLDVKKDGVQYGTELDLDGLLRLDPATQADMWSKLVSGAISSPNEARLRFNLPPAVGGDTPYLQQQNYSLQALDQRDQTNPLAAPPPAPPAPPAPLEPPPPAKAFSSEAFIKRFQMRAQETVDELAAAQ